MIVVDASVVVAALTDVDAPGGWARAQLRGTRILAPHLMPVEVTHAVRRRVSLGQLADAAAAAALKDLAALDVEHVAFTRFADRVWQLRDTVTPYDAWYVAVAEAVDAPLVSLDLRLAGAPGPRCRFVVPPA